MNCRSCNTQIPRGKKACPACGKGLRSTDLLEASRSEEGPGPLSPSTHAAARVDEPDIEPDVDFDDDEDELDEVELDEVTLDEVELDEEVTPVPTPKPRRAAPSARPARRAAPAAPKAPAAPLFSMEPDQLRSLIVEQPELLEPGLSVYVDESGREVGAGFDTDLGEIDLLASDAAGDLVIVMVAEASDERDQVAEMLHRIGWATRHLVQKTESVRGILLAESLDQRTGYAAAAVGDTIEIKLYRVALSFETVTV